MASMHRLYHMPWSKLCLHCPSWTILILTSKPQAPQNDPLSMSHRTEMKNLENCYPPPLNSSLSHPFFQSCVIYQCGSCPVALGQKKDLLHAPSVQRNVVLLNAVLVCPMLCNTGSFLLTTSPGVCILVELLGTKNIFSDAWTTLHLIQQKLLKY